MSFPPLPETVTEFDVREWASFEPYYDELAQRELTADNLRDWLRDWSDLSRVLHESISRVYIDKSLDTTDKEKEQLFLDMIDNVMPPAQVADQALKERLLAMDVVDEDMTLVLRNMRNEAELFREENIPLQTELQKLSNEYDKVTGSLKADWDGEEKNLSQLQVLLRKKDRSVRERAWKTMMALWQSARPELNKIYSDMLPLRRQVAQNAGLPDYQAYTFRQLGRFDYTPEDCLIFHQAIEEVVVPAARRIVAKKQARLGLDKLRPWDVDVEANDLPPLAPYDKQDELIQTSLNIFNKVDAELGRYFAIMAEEQLLDLDTRAGKALGGYCSHLPWQKRPFIFMNGTGSQDDVQTMLHEAGHAFHAFEADNLPLIWQTDVPMEFCEVASMAMELLAAPYLTGDNGGFYTAAEAARARIEHLESILIFLPYMAVVDAFQHWVYTHPEEAQNPDNLDAAWGALWDRFLKGVDWDGFEAERVSGWHRKLHVFTVPFYYIEYGMAQVGALQVWRNSLANHPEALAAYRRSLALGGTRTLPELFAAASAEFRFDTAMLSELVELVEGTVSELESET